MFHESGSVPRIPPRHTRPVFGFRPAVSGLSYAGGCADSTVLGTRYSVDDLMKKNRNGTITACYRDSKLGVSVGTCDESATVDAPKVDGRRSNE